MQKGALNHFFIKKEHYTITADLIRHAVSLGCRNTNQVKAQTRCGMGPCQGRVCGPAVEQLFDWPRESLRPPVFPVSVETLGGTGAEGGREKGEE